MICNVNSINMRFQYVMHIPGQTNREILLGLGMYYINDGADKTNQGKLFCFHVDAFLYYCKQ